MAEIWDYFIVRFCLQDLQPVGALMLIKYEVTRTVMPDQSNRPHSFRIHKEGASGLHLAAENEEATTRWIAVISHAVEKCSQVSLAVNSPSKRIF